MAFEPEPRKYPPLAASNRSTYAASSNNPITGNRYDPTIASSLRSSHTLYRRMKDTVSLLRGRSTNNGSIASLASRNGMVSLAGSIDNLSDIMRDSLSISEAPLQEQLLQRENESRLGQEVEDCK